MQKKMQKALNKQINEELYSAYSYLAMAAEADRMKLPGFVNWFKMQYQEELAHADRFFNFILERDGEVELDAIAKPELRDETPLSLFEKALEHEQHITQCIFNLKDLARAESDYATDVFLEWFVHVDKWLHGVIFVFLAIWFAGQYRRRSYWRIGLGLIAFGVLIEACQRLVTYRSADVFDIAADAAGIAIGLAIALSGLGGWSMWVENRFSKEKASVDID